MGGEGSLGVKYNMMLARQLSAREKIQFLPNSVSKSKSPNLPDPLQCRRSARWYSQLGGGGAGVGGDMMLGNGGRWMIECGGKKGIILHASCLLMHEFEG
jgi:hypothetical protein